jgi:hypothetical protein
MQSLLVGAALLLAYDGQAQSRPVAPRRTAAPRPRPKTTGVMAKDGLTMANGKVSLTEMGLTTPLTQDKKLLNGTVVTTTGQVTSAGGTTEQMKEGDLVSLTGRLTTKREMIEADSVRKLVDYDLKHPGKRKEMEKAREKAEKAKEKADKEKEKQKAKAKK